jgi:flotillin
MRQAEYQANVNQKKADADLAYDLEKYKIEQSVKAESVKVIAVEKERMIEVQEKETLRKEQELQATVQKPAEAEQKRIMMMADANRYQVEAEANARALAAKNVGIAEAEAARAKGMAEAEVIKAKGTAEAEAMMRKADAWRAYNEAAVAQMFIEKLPDLARAIAEPLQKIDKIVLIGNGSDGTGMSKISKEVIDIISQLPPVLEGVAGVKLQDLIAKLPKLSKGTEPGPGRKQA